jgi:hypothetical protein
MHGQRIVIAMAALMAGCQTLKDGDRRQPPPPPIKPPTEYVQPRVEITSETSRVVWRPKKSVWQSYMLALSRTDYFIDSAVEDDGVMSVRYNGDPVPYVDCGEVVANVKGPQGERSERFPGAATFKQYQISNRGKVYQVERRMVLTARTTLTFTSVDSKRTKVDARTVYTVTRDQTAVTPNEKPLMLHDTISFNTGENGVFPNAATRCQSTGKMEKDVLAFLK